MTTKSPDPRRGMLRTTVDVFLDRTRTVTELLTTVGTAGARAAGADPVLGPVTRMLASLRTLAEQVPQLTDEFDVLVEEVHAKRVSIRALQTELAALDHQLEILEQSLAPVQAWSHQWGRVQHALLHSLDLPAQPPE